MSGTSGDGVDAALVDFSGQLPRLLATRQLPYDAALRQRLLAIAQGDGDDAEHVGRLDHELGLWFARAARALLDATNLPANAIRAIGSHGHTLRHRPSGAHPFTWQIGDANLIAEQTGITTVADLRRRDMAAGGQGAPLAPAFHQALFASTDEDRALVNIGGIANLTILPCNPAQPVIGFDTGPGNALMDAWIGQHQDQPYDAQGTWSASGAVDESLLQRLLAEPYFAKRAPKSTGRELFNLPWLEAALPDSARAPAPADVQATLCELTARSIAVALSTHLPTARALAVCGGGARNPQLLARLQAQLAGCEVVTTNIWGVDAQWVEAVGFAWLAMRTLAGLPGNLPSVTGARRPVVLGAIYPGTRGL